MVASRRPESERLAHAMPRPESPLTQDEPLTGGLCVVGLAPVSHSLLWEQAPQGRAQDPGKACMAQALGGLNCRGIHATRDAAAGRLASGERHLTAHHSPEVFPGPHARHQAVSPPRAAKRRAAPKAATQAEERRNRGPERLHNANRAPEKRGPGRPPQGAPCVEPVKQAVDAAGQAPQRLTRQRAQVAQSLRPIGHASHWVDLERGVRRTGKRIARALHQPIDTMRTSAQQAGLSQACLDRLAHAARVVPTRQATIACVSSEVRQQGHPLDVTPPPSDALPAQRIPADDLERVASTRRHTAGEPLRALAARRRTSLFAPGGALAAFSPVAQNRRKGEAAKRAEVFQRSSSKVEGRQGYLSLRNQHLRGLDHPSTPAGLTAVQNFVLTRPDGTTAAERFFGQKPRSMFAALLASVAIPPAPLRPPRRPVG